MHSSQIDYLYLELPSLSLDTEIASDDPLFALLIEVFKSVQSLRHDVRLHPSITYLEDFASLMNHTIPPVSVEQCLSHL